jgi:hypothetical protein
MSYRVNPLVPRPKIAAYPSRAESAIAVIGDSLGE